MTKLGFIKLNEPFNGKVSKMSRLSTTPPYSFTCVKGEWELCGQLGHAGQLLGITFVYNPSLGITYNFRNLSNKHYHPTPKTSQDTHTDSTST